jgi:dTDP-4-amino-4,6-dideoxygalactose transaminase
MRTRAADTVIQNNPKLGYTAQSEQIDTVIKRVLDSGKYILDNEVESFEKEFARYLGVSYAIGVASGTDAIELALRSLHIGWGDTVVTVSNTALATVAAIMRTGAQPLFVDIDPKTYTMSPESFEGLMKKLLKKPKAVIPVHLYGHPADIATIQSIANSYGIYVIEDCAQAHGATINGRKVGGLGHVSAFSFYPTKNLGAYGDAGCVVTNDKCLAENLYSLRQYGCICNGDIITYGINSRLDELQAAILRVKLENLDIQNRKRIECAYRYSNSLSSIHEIDVPYVNNGAQHVFHQYVIRVRHRDLLKQKLLEYNIETKIHYPIPIHKQSAYVRQWTPHISLDITERIASEILSLPMYPEMSEETIQYVVEVIDWALENVMVHRELDKGYTDLSKCLPLWESFSFGPDLLAKGQKKTCSVYWPFQTSSC